ncbi:MAG: LacI family DNA-binding transcriptional regulator [Lentisphaeria bacterium]|nr:LacI family DNA-binding transcriptional regulator [Lentisphaeria bacterium]
MAKKAGSDVSISDIAEKCGVSAMTVSRVMRQSPVVSKKTRELVLAAAEELGYLKGSRLGRPAGTPRDAHTRVRLICGTPERGPVVFQMRLLSAVERALTARNCECVLYCGTGDYRTFLRLQASALKTEAQATFIIGDFPEKQLTSLIAAFPGAVLIDNPGTPDTNASFNSFAFDNAAAAELALSHLLEQGYDNPLILTGPERHFFSREIETGCRRFMKSHGKAMPEIIRTDYTPASAEIAMKKYLASGKKFDSVFTTDEIATGVYRAMLSSGRNIPGDAAICGCDNLPSGAVLYPSLTTISLDYEELARSAVEFVLRKEKNGIPKRIRLMPSLIIRESTAKRN